MTTARDARFWDRAARRYARSQISDQAGYERTLERTRALLGQGDRVLELGCGTGSTALRLAPVVKSYLATDISPKMIGIAQAKAAESAVAGLTFQTATAESLTPAPGSFDAVLGFNYLHLVRDPQGTLRRIHSLLAPGGLFISKTPCLGEMNRLIQWGLLPAMRALGLAPHVTVLDAAALTGMMEQARFGIIATERHATKGKDCRPFILASKV